MRSNSRVILLLLAWAAIGCACDASVGLWASMDAGGPADCGAPTGDAGPRADAGGPDAGGSVAGGTDGGGLGGGAADGGGPDAGLDAGLGAKDAGNPVLLHARCGWIGPGDENGGVESFVAHATYFQVIHPVWYALNPDGITVKPVGVVDDPRVLNAAASNSVRVWPLVYGGDDASILRSMLNDPSTMQAHVRQLVQLSNDHGYAGLEIDYEHLWSGSDRPPFTTFIQALSSAMHAAGRQVSIAVPALTDNSDTNAWDYDVLSASLDALHIMGYDYHGVGTHPGPVSPLAWVDASCAHAQATGRGVKFILGVPNYGVDGTGGACIGTDCAAACGGAYDTVDTHMQACSYGYWDAGRSPHCTAGGYTRYFDDNASLEQKVNAAVAHGLGGVTYYDLGKEPDGMLEMFRLHY